MLLRPCPLALMLCGGPVLRVPVTLAKAFIWPGRVPNLEQGEQNVLQSSSAGKQPSTPEAPKAVGYGHSFLATHGDGFVMPGNSLLFLNFFLNFSITIYIQ